MSTEQFADRLRAHPGPELVAVLLAADAVLFLGEQLHLFERGITGIDDHVVLEVDHFLQEVVFIPSSVAQTAGHRLEEPDVHDRGGQVDMAHPLAAHARVRDLHAAAVADDALVLGALVLAARALPVALRTEDPLAEQPSFSAR
jgi:hypothetical protein